MSETLKNVPAEQRNWRLPFRPTEYVLKATRILSDEDPILDGARFNSGKSAIRHADEQYYGIDPDLIDTPEVTIFQASDLVEKDEGP